VVAVDLHSKWPEVMMCGTVTTTNIIEFLTSPFSRFGLSNLGTKHSCTTMYSPRMELLSVSIVFWMTVLRQEWQMAVHLHKLSS